MKILLSSCDQYYPYIHVQNELHTTNEQHVGNHVEGREGVINRMGVCMS